MRIRGAFWAPRRNDHPVPMPRAAPSNFRRTWNAYSPRGWGPAMRWSRSASSSTRPGETIVERRHRPRKPRRGPPPSRRRATIRAVIRPAAGVDGRVQPARRRCHRRGRRVLRPIHRIPRDRHFRHVRDPARNRAGARHDPARLGGRPASTASPNSTRTGNCGWSRALRRRSRRSRHWSAPPSDSTMPGGDTVTVQSMAFDEAAIADVTEPGLLETP